MDNLRNIMGLTALSYLPNVGSGEKLLVASPAEETSYIQPNPCLFCIFCYTADHVSHECTRFKSSKEFWMRVLADRRCKNCLRLYHRSETCYNQSFCHISNCKCRDKHSVVLCQRRYAWHQFQTNPFKLNFKSSRGRRISVHHDRYRWFYEGTHKSPIVKPHYRNDQNGINKNQPLKRSTSSPHLQFMEYATVKSQTCQVAQIDASTQTDYSSESRVQKCSCGTQANASVTSMSMQTDVHIPPAVDIFNDTPPVIETEINVAAKIEEEPKNKIQNTNVPHYYSNKVIDNTAAPSQSFPDFLLSTVDSMVSDLKLKAQEKKLRGFAGFPHWR